MRIFTPFVAVSLISGISGPAFAEGDCTCRGNGQDIPEGQTVCLKTASGMQMARCERVLNNTSWKMLDNDCPTASLPARSRVKNG